MEDFDIYGSIDVGNSRKDVEKILADYDILKKQHDELICKHFEAENQRSQTEKKLKIVETNFSSLLKTAKAELSRKINQITELQQIIDERPRLRDSHRFPIDSNRNVNKRSLPRDEKDDGVCSKKNKYQKNITPNVKSCNTFKQQENEITPKNYVPSKKREVNNVSTNAFDETTDRKTHDELKNVNAKNVFQTMSSHKIPKVKDLVEIQQNNVSQSVASTFEGIEQKENISEISTTNHPKISTVIDKTILDNLTNNYGDAIESLLILGNSVRITPSETEQLLSSKDVKINKPQEFIDDKLQEELGQNSVNVGDDLTENNQAQKPDVSLNKYIENCSITSKEQQCKKNKTRQVEYVMQSINDNESVVIINRKKKSLNRK